MKVCALNPAGIFTPAKDESNSIASASVHLVLQACAFACQGSDAIEYPTQVGVMYYRRRLMCLQSVPTGLEVARQAEAVLSAKKTRVEDHQSV